MQLLRLLLIRGGYLNVIQAAGAVGRDCGRAPSGSGLAVERVDPLVHQGEVPHWVHAAIVAVQDEGALVQAGVAMRAPALLLYSQ